MTQGAQPGAVAALSLNPEDAEAASFALPDGNYLWSQVRFELFDYPLRKAGPLPVGQRAVMLTATLTGDDGVASEQRWNSGNEKDYVPSQDGMQLIPTGTRKGLSENSACYVVMKGAVDAGFTGAIGQSIGVLEGMYAFHTVATAKYNIDGRDVESQYLVPSKMLDATTRPVVAGAVAAPAAAGAVPVAPVAVAAPPAAPAAPAVAAPPAVAAVPAVAAPPVVAASAASAAPAAPNNLAPVSQTPAQESAKAYVAGLIGAAQLPGTIPQLTTAAFAAYGTDELAPLRNDVSLALNDGTWLASTGLVVVTGQEIAPA